MQGQLFTLFGTGLPSYFVLLLTGFVFATAVGALWAARIGHNPDVVVDLGIGVLIAGILGARMLHVLADGYLWDYVNLCLDPSKVDWRVTREQCVAPDFGGIWNAAKGVCHPAERDCFRWAAFWAGGLTYYGGLLGASLAAWFLLKADRFPFLRAADMAGIAVPLGLSFGRMGCWLAGCCFGQPTASLFGIVFPGGSPASEAQFRAGLRSSPHQPSLAVHPTQLYEAGGALIISAVLALHLHGRKRFDGQIFLVFLASYAVLRFLLEYLRADDRGGWLGLSTSQLIGLVILAAATGGYVHLHRLAALRA